MPYWTVPEEHQLLDMVPEGRPLEEIADYFKRSPESIRLKCKRLGVTAPPANKVTTTTTTMSAKLEPVSVGELPSPMEAMTLLWAAVKRLQQPDVGREEAEKLMALGYEFHYRTQDGADLFRKKVVGLD